MEWSSWFRKALLKVGKLKGQPRLQQSDVEEYGVTDKLADLIRTFTVDTFKSFPLQDYGDDELGRDIESGAYRCRKCAERYVRMAGEACHPRARWSQGFAVICRHRPSGHFDINKMLEIPSH